MKRTLTVCVVAAWLVTAVASAQTDPTITTAVVTNATQMTVVFSENLTSRPAAPQFDVHRVRLLPDNVTPSSIVQNGLALNSFTLNFAGVPGTATRLCFDRVEFGPAASVSTSAAQVCADVTRDPEAVKREWIAALQKVPKTARDKDIFASGFVTTASKASAGGGDISVNPNFNVPNLNAFMTIKKATADEGDSRHFEAGARYRFTRTWKPAEMRAIAAEGDQVKLNALIRARQTNIIAGWLVDAAGKLEGDPTNFDVTNAVAESSLQVQTLTRGFLGRRGFWRGFVLPAGLEIGQNLGTTVPANPTTPGAPAPEPPVNRIARYKAGAGFTVYFDNPKVQLGIRRFELDVNGVLRQLFLNESRFNAETKKTDITDKGLQPYAQIDLKLFVGETPSGRFGVKLSFNRGRLPPVYAEVKSFTFGFVIESGDAKTPAAPNK
jgi:hypothetical protein